MLRGAARLRLFESRWSPDGTKLAVIKDPASVWVVDVSSGAVRQVAAPTVTREVDWSPDGRRFAFGFGRGHSDSEQPIFVAKVDGSSRRQLTRPRIGTSDWNPRWAPDGKSLLFVRSRGSVDVHGFTERSGIYRIDASGGTPVPILNPSVQVLSRSAGHPTGARSPISPPPTASHRDPHLRHHPPNRPRVNRDLCRPNPGDDSTCGTVDWQRVPTR